MARHRLEPGHAARFGPAVRMVSAYERAVATLVRKPDARRVARRDGRRRAGAAGLAVKVVSKAGTALPGLVKILKFGKVALAGASLATYALLFSWRFAVVIMAVIFIHEYTHVLVMKRFGMRVRGMYFIPFVGAAAVPEDDFPDRKTEAIAAYAGPLTGLVLGLLGLGLFALTRNGYVAAITAFTAAINLFNLLPVSPLDGGRVVKSVAMSIGTRAGFGFMVAALLAAAVLAFRERVLIFVILVPLALLDLFYERVKHQRAQRAYLKKKAAADERGDPLPARPHAMINLSRRAIPVVFGAYAALAAALFAIIVVMNSEPGAVAALNVLRG